MESQDLLSWAAVAAAVGCGFGFSAQREPFPFGTDLVARQRREDPLGTDYFERSQLTDRANLASLEGAIAMLDLIFRDNRFRQNFDALQFAKYFVVGAGLVLCGRFFAWPALLSGLHQVNQA